MIPDFLEPARSYILVAAAIFSAVGMLLIAFGAFEHYFIRKRSLVELRDLKEFVGAYTGDSRIAERLFGSAAFALYRAQRDNEEKLRNELDLVGYPKGLRSVSDYYIAKLYNASIWLVYSLILVIIAIIFLGAPAFVAFIVPLATSFGYIFPDLRLQSLRDQRKMQIVLEIPEVWSVIQNNYNLTGSLEQAFVMYATQNTRGGYLFYEIVRMVKRYSEGLSFADALHEMAARNQDIPVVARVLSTLEMSVTQGTPVGQALKESIRLARESVNNTITARAMRNNGAVNAVSMLYVLGMLVLVGVVIFGVFQGQISI